MKLAWFVVSLSSQPTSRSIRTIRRKLLLVLAPNRFMLYFLNGA